MLDLLEDQSFDKDTETLQKFYESVKMRASGIDNAEGKQRIIIELYDKFFKSAFPKMVEQLGIVYTPVECVDFIIHSVNDVLKKEFGRSVSDENVHILDPFTGTGTFITRLLQSGLIELKDLERKYKHEIHANEIVLLAYYIAAINIENAYHDATPDPNDGIGTDKYTPFDGIVLTDTFQLGESNNSERLFSEMFPQNSERVAKQMNSPLRVIIGNPPYSVGQKSADDNAQNLKYEKLDKRIENTYANLSNATSVKSLYDSYFKAFRWASDRLDKINGGVIAFITNSGWLDSNGSDGFRKSLQNEFTSIYVINLRGAIRGKNGDLAKKEGQNIFDIMTGVAVTILVKNPNKKTDSEINYFDIGNYLSKNEKLNFLSKNKTEGIANINWSLIIPNNENDWLSKRSNIFEQYMPLNPDKKYDIKTQSIFISYSLGIASSRDSWVFNSSENKLKTNLRNFLEFYKFQREGYINSKKSDINLKFEDYIQYDSKKISWNDSLKNLCSNNIDLRFNDKEIRKSLYRPYYKTNVYFEKNLIQRPYQQFKIYPNNSSENIIICVQSLGGNKEYTPLITDLLPDLHLNGDSQCFPLYYYEERQKQSSGLFDEDGDSEFIRRDAISNFILERAKAMYGKTVNKEDIFYYVYGFLHSTEYRELFANDLKKMLPRLPLVEDVRDFWKFSKAGRALAELHINYETVPAYDDVKVVGAEKLTFLDEEPKDSGLFKVEKMRFPKKDQKDTINYNSKITITNIPAKAYDYVVNGKSAIEWIMERYAVTTHKESGITNNPNDWADEVGNPRYILDLLLSIINVSVQTVDIVEGLPKVKFE